MNWKLIVIVLIILVLGGGGFYYYQSTKKTDKPVEETEITSSIDEPTNTPTPAEVDKSAFTIKILNGSGIEGEAGKAQDLIEGDDFTVDSTGNADNYDYDKTVIQASSDVSDEWIDMLRETLSTKYTVQKSVEDVDSSADTDVVVIIGSLDDKGDSMAPKEDTTPTPEETSTEATETPEPSPTPTP